MLCFDNNEREKYFCVGDRGGEQMRGMLVEVNIGVCGDYGGCQLDLKDDYERHDKSDWVFCL
jgi:hypothetical protein